MKDKQIKLDKKWLTSKQAAEYLGYHEATMKKARVTGFLAGKEQPQYHKVGSSIRYDIKELDRWVIKNSEKTYE